MIELIYRSECGSEFKKTIDPEVAAITDLETSGKEMTNLKNGKTYHRVNIVNYGPTTKLERKEWEKSGK